MKKFMISAAIVLGLCSGTSAQKMNVRIHVVDETGRPLQGVMMHVGNDSGNTFISDNNGLIECQTDKGENLNFEKYNQLRRNVKVTGPEMIVRLDNNNRLLDMGYDLYVTKENSTAAIDGVSNTAMKLSGETNPLNTLYGMIPGLAIYQADALPYKSTPDIYVRGTGSNIGNKVLVLVDGVEREIGSVNVDEIESVSVLKDAASLALYGNRGANGVVCITTRRGGNYKMRTNVEYNFMVQRPFRVPDMAGAVAYANAVNEAAAYDGSAPRYSAADIAALRNGTSPLGVVDWKKQILRKNAYNNELNLSIDGSNGRLRYFVFANYTSNRGFFNNTDLNDGYSTQAEMYALKLRSNLEAALSPTTTARMNLMGRLMQYQEPVAGTSLENMYTTPAIASPIYGNNGTWAKNQMFTNPLAEQSAKGYNLMLQRTLFADLIIDQNLSMLTPGLSASVRISYDNSADIADKRSKSYAYSIATPVTDASGNISDMSFSRFGNDTEIAFSSSLNAQVMRTYIQAKVDYEREFGIHRLGASAIYAQGRRKYLEANGTDAFRDYILHLSYGYDNRYLADVVCSYSGALKLPAGHKYNFYPAVSVAWVISNEGFMKNTTLIDFLKLRASYGISGNDANLKYDMDKQLNGDKVGYLFAGTSPSYGFTLGDLASIGIAPEKEYKANIGIELGLLNNLSMQADLFYNRRTNIMTATDGIYSSVIGRGTGYLFNGEVKNYGGEFSATWNHRIGNVIYYVNGNISYARNEIVNMNEQYHPYSYMYATGNSIGRFYGLVADGLYQADDFDSQGRLKAGYPVSAYESNLRPGDVKYKDLNGDNRIDDYDQCYQQYSTLPEIYYGINLGASYKGFGLRANFQGAAMRTVATNLPSIYQPLYGNDKNVSEHYLENRWTSGTPDAKYPRLTNKPNNHNFRASSLWTENGDYFKLRVLELSYSLPQQLIGKMRMSGCRVFVKGMNLFSVDNVKVMDPEQIDMEYPSARSYMAGIHLSF